MKRISLKVKVTLIFAALMLAAALAYTRPMTLAQICGDIDVSESNYVYGYYVDYPRMAEDARFEIKADDERLGEMLQLFKNQKFKRSLWNLLPRGTKYHVFEDGDFKWEVLFNFENVTLPDGSGARGSVIHVSNFFGIVEVRFDGDTIRCNISDKEAWLKDVMDIIKKQ